MSILEKILKDLYVEPELLAELDEEQKQLLFCKMREEQVRRWLNYEQQLASVANGQSEAKPKSSARVQWLLDDNGEPWVWVMGEESDGIKKTVDEAIRNRLNQVQTHQNGPSTANQITTRTLRRADDENDDWQLERVDEESADRSKGVAKIPVSEEVLLDVERQIRSMARRAREQHRINNLTVDNRLRIKNKSDARVSSAPPLGQVANGHPSKAHIVNWYRRSEFPKMAGLDRSGRSFALWFHGQLSRPEAEDMLAARDNGAFLVRLSEKICGYVLSYQAGYKMKHFMILSSTNGYHFIGSNQTVHETLNSLVDHHSVHPITDAGMELLREPIGQCRLRPDYYEFLDLLR